MAVGAVNQQVSLATEVPPPELGAVPSVAIWRRMLHGAGSAIDWLFGLISMVDGKVPKPSWQM